MTVAASIIACNSGQTASKNKEGMEEHAGNQESGWKKRTISCYRSAIYVFFKSVEVET